MEFSATRDSFSRMSRRGRLHHDQYYAHRDAWSKWVLPALVASLILHGLLWNWTRQFPVERMSDSFYEKIVPRTFHLERVDIDPRLLEPEPDESVQIRQTPIALPEERISLDKQPSALPDLKNPPRLDQAILDEKPSLPEPSTLEADAAKPSSALLPADDDLARDIIKDLPAVSKDASPAEPLPALRAGTDTENPNTGAGFSDLDKLLAQTGPLTSETAPILLPGDLLFEYDDHRLQQAAVSSLEKLGLLLKRSPNARFVIEGHSDSFGPDDYNLTLSKLRAESVKIWLIDMVGIPAESISTVGLGKTKLAAPATGTIEEQRVNRRVEIVIKDAAP
jgi:outer membrane protein OmpA-like peptidoglycan-associated protein